jgi:manganese oxidase
MNACRTTTASLAVITLFVIGAAIALIAGGSGAAAGSGAASASPSHAAAEQVVLPAGARHAAIVDGFLSAYTGGTVPLDDATGEVREFTLEVHQIMTEIAPGVEVEQWAFGFPGEEPSVPGPEIRVQEGDLVRITLDNTHAQPHTLHFHGIISVAQMHDGVPHVSLQVMPGQSHTYEFVAANPGTHAYHCHVDTFTHHDYGMYGALIIEPKDERVVWDRDYTLILDEWDSRQTSSHAVHDPEYDYFLINGLAFPSVPDLEIGEDEVALLRFINMGYEPHAMHLHGSNFLVTHKDGYALDAPYQADTLLVAPGERYHVLLKGRDGAFPFHDHMLQFVLNAGVYPGGMHLMVTSGVERDAHGVVVEAAHDEHGGHAQAPAREDLPLLGDTEMDIVDFAFEQPVIRIAAGSTVTWTNRDEAPHTVTSGRPGDAPDGRAFDSTGMADGGMQMMMQGDSWSHTFDEPGEYEYFCLPHVNMVATIIVE